MLYVTDKKGIHPHPQALFDGFRSTIEDCSISELALTGGEFTWEKSKGTPNYVRERFDRTFATDTWWHKFLICNLSVIHKTHSDHDPIKLDLAAFSFSRKQFRFRFENTWLKEQTFHEEVSMFWKGLSPTHLLPNLISVSSFMANWGRNFFHQFREKVRKQKEVLNELVNGEDEDGVKKYFEERDQFNDLLLHEEQYWKQRAKAFWLTEGDTNSKFFHAQASSRKKLNHIAHLKNDAGDLIDNHDAMCEMMKEYYKGL
ncbi:uncharacterized protein LOC141679913 [Apium graveolens]|uniref:uncharacterized protein LOC141679913 n=1 Tax=Apium graveolens TaxID=4045 RepID=UPI003D7A3303